MGGAEISGDVYGDCPKNSVRGGGRRNALTSHYIIAIRMGQECRLMI